MPNDYLRDVHIYLKRQILDHQVHLSRNQTGGHPAHEAYYSGIVEQLQEIRRFLSDHFNLRNHDYDT
jgi:hypothetical protein